MPFLRLTRDRRGIEHTFLLHAYHPGDRPRLLYWYRTAPGIVLGRAPLDEDAIRTIEDHHPDIDFDWPAILALSEVMTPEEDVAPVRPAKRNRPRRSREEAREAPPAAGTSPSEPLAPAADGPDAEEIEHPSMHTALGLLEQLVGREIATRLRARYAEVSARIHERDEEPFAREAWLRRADSLDPSTWLTPESILEGVRNADALFEQLRQELHDH